MREGWATCFALRQSNPVEPNRIVPHAVTPNATPSGYGPSDIQSAYNLPSSTAGSGTTVAIVDAYDDPNAESDLATYRSQYGLPACTTANGCFTKLNQSGTQGSYPTANTGWAGEISLDLDAVSAACPACKIMLVEANSASMPDLGTAVNTAVAKGAKYVSNSYGGSEDSTTNSEDSSYYKHAGVFITASTGDSDYGAEFPATSAYVTAVGGTSLSRASGTSRGWTESVWYTSSSEGTGSGCSAYVAKPSFQSGVSTGCSKRAEADVSMDADPATGLAVYQTYGGSGWSVYGGTSLASPLLASTAALAGAAGNSTYGNDLSYSHTADFNDVTSGSNGSCGTVLCNAGTGWDGPSGNGTPDGVAGFGAPTTSGVTVTNPGSKSSASGTAVSLQLAASGGTSPYTWSASGLPSGLSISSSGLVSGTPTKAGTYSVTVTATDATGTTASATFPWTVTASGGGGSTCSGQLVQNPGFESGAANWTESNSNIIGQWGADEPPYAGSYDAWLDGYGTTHTDTLSQSITIPSGCTAKLSYYLHIDTDETGPTAYDKLTVKAGSTKLATYSNVNAASGYTLHTVNLSAFAGKTVKITFTGTEDDSLQTSFVLDNVTANLS
ncbi:S53 family peptidase [Flexivirga caeni]|uniref:S53 family peptidase n=1 Tax=Flexivirga caeni TaxID=2294115 RepID=UPI001FE311B0|nr:S53 family peptidase [Flexivirga caeni]